MTAAEFIIIGHLCYIIATLGDWTAWWILGGVWNVLGIVVYFIVASKHHG